MTKNKTLRWTRTPEHEQALRLGSAVREMAAQYSREAMRIPEEVWQRLHHDPQAAYVLLVQSAKRDRLDLVDPGKVWQLLGSCDALPSYWESSLSHLHLCLGVANGDDRK